MEENCWEFKKCHRLPGDIKAKELGICPAFKAYDQDSKNSGINGGRLCWSIAGTLCKGTIQGSYARKITTCVQCDFFKKVQKEQGDTFVLS